MFITRTNPLQRYLLLNDGEGEGGDPTTGGGGGGGADGGDDAKPRTLTQSDVDRIVKGRVAETARQTEERISKELGLSISEAKELIQSAREADDKMKSEAQKEREAAEKEKREAEAEKAAAKRERFEASVERALLRAGVEDGKLSRAMKVLDIEPDDDADAIKKAVEALKSDEPGWFGAEGKKTPPDTDPKGNPPKQQKSQDAYAKGAERAKALAGQANYPILSGDGK